MILEKDESNLVREHKKSEVHEEKARLNALLIHFSGGPTSLAAAVESMSCCSLSKCNMFSEAIQRFEHLLIIWDSCSLLPRLSREVQFGRLWAGSASRRRTYE